MLGQETAALEGGLSEARREFNANSSLEGLVR